MQLETFDDVLLSIKKNNSRKFHLLLGNGFSVAYNPNMFSYNALHDFMSNLQDSDLSKILSVIETRNFEIIMQQLDTCTALIEAFDGNSALKIKIEESTKALKRKLLEAVNALHPEHVFKVPEAQSKICAAFLEHFLGANGGIYSTNYDLLLYWVLLRNVMQKHNDGCGREQENFSEEFTPPEDQIWSELTWGKHRKEQNTFYLHGALQFFDDGTSIVKEEYSGHEYLLAGISKRMEKGQYPIFVTAGDGQQKLEHITHNQYLNFCYDKLCSLDGSLVTYGFRFGAYDEHIIDAINRAAKNGKNAAEKLRSIYIGVYSKEDHDHIEQIAHKFKCKLRIYDAKTANVWGH